MVSVVVDDRVGGASKAHREPERDEQENLSDRIAGLPSDDAKTHARQG